MSGPARILGEAQRQAEAAREQVLRMVAERRIWADLGAGIASAEETAERLAALEPAALAVAPGPKRAAAREPGDEEEPPEAHTVGLVMVELFTATKEGPVGLSSHEQKRRIANALAGIRDEDGAPVIYGTPKGLARISTTSAGDPVIAHISDGVDVRILVDRYLVCGVPVKTKTGTEVRWSNSFQEADKRMGELARQHQWHDVGVRLPHLKSVRSFPFFDADFRLVNDRGYHAETRCYLDRSTPIQFPDPGETPLTVLAEWMSDFIEQTFANPWDYTYAIAFLITILMRPAIDGPTPMFAVMASMPRIGKGKLVNAICRAAMGTTAMGMPLSKETDRQIHEVLSALGTGRPVAVVDNERQDKAGDTFGGPAIESMLTEPTYSGRLLGGNTQVEYEVEMILAMTGNNPAFTFDMACRICPIELLSRKQQADARGGWAHPDIEKKTGYTMRIRAKILGAVVMMVEQWRGRRAAGETWITWAPGGFEAWGQIVGAVCISAGLPDWGKGIEKFKNSADPEQAAYSAWAEIIADLLLATNRRHMYGAEVVATVSRVDYWTTKHGGDSERVSTQRAWAIVRSAVGRVWDLPARTAVGAGGVETVRAAGLLTLKGVDARSGVTAAVFTWSER